VSLLTAGELDQMTFKDPFQLKRFYLSKISMKVQILAFCTEDRKRKTKKTRLEVKNEAHTQVFHEKKITCPVLVIGKT